MVLTKDLVYNKKILSKDVKLINNEVGVFSLEPFFYRLALIIPFLCILLCILKSKNHTFFQNLIIIINFEVLSIIGLIISLIFYYYNIFRICMTLLIISLIWLTFIWIKNKN
jgi:hypothetical protein